MCLYGNVIIISTLISGNSALPSQPWSWCGVLAGHDLRQVRSYCDVTGGAGGVCGVLYAVMEHHQIHRLLQNGGRTDGSVFHDLW